MKKSLVYGIGINNAGYAVKKYEEFGYEDGKQKSKLIWSCPYHETWTSMLRRCYSVKYQDRFPTYKDCTVSDEWLSFSNFRSWMMTQNWEGKELDKDLLIKGNKIYSPDTCVFVSQAVNSFTIESGATRGKWLIGVCWHKRDGKFQSYCSNPFTHKKDHLGYYTTEQEAHAAWLKRKLEIAHELAAIQTDERVAQALIERYTSYIP